MTAPLDFPPTPIVGQKYTAPSGAVYEWDGFGWTVGYYDSNTQQLLLMGDLLDQVRTLLQDVDNSGSSGYRYSTDSIVTALNQGFADLFRIRPDLFLELGFVLPSYTVDQLDIPIKVEAQYVPPLIMYVVGLVQARDDEQTQDARAGIFLQTFKAAVLTVN
jgi:hypothetical protein